MLAFVAAALLGVSACPQPAHPERCSLLVEAGAGIRGVVVEPGGRRLGPTTRTIPGGEYAEWALGRSFSFAGLGPKRPGTFEARLEVTTGSEVGLRVVRMVGPRAETATFWLREPRGTQLRLRLAWSRPLAGLRLRVDGAVRAPDVVVPLAEFRSPTTSASLTPAADSRWHVALTAADAGGSGLYATRYAVGASPLRTYLSPFLVADGTLVRYHSLDRAGNREAPHELRAVATSANEARALLRAAVPALHAYRADHATWAGVTLSALQRYDAGLRGLVVLSGSAHAYCVASSGTGTTWYLHGPAAEISETPCG